MGVWTFYVLYYNQALCTQKAYSQSRQAGRKGDRMNEVPMEPRNFCVGSFSNLEMLKSWILENNPLQEGNLEIVQGHQDQEETPGEIAWAWYPNSDSDLEVRRLIFKN